VGAGMSRSVLACGIAAGAVLGTVYAASPLTVWFLAVMAGLFAWTSRGLTERERRWVLGVLAVAVAVRMLTIAWLFATTDHYQAVSFFWDGDGQALKRRALSIRNIWLGIPVAPLFYSLAFEQSYGWTTYLYVLAYIQYWLGPAPYGIHLVNVALFVAGAVALYRLVRSAYGRASAFVGLVILLFLPTPFLWSVSALKESMYVFLLVIGLVAAVHLVRGRFSTRVIALAILMASVAVIDGVRAGAQLIATLGLAAGLAASFVVRRVSILLLVLLLGPIAARQAWNDPGVQTAMMSQVQAAALQHLGQVRSPGYSYKLLDERAYSIDRPTLTPVESGRFVVRALVSFVVVPLPWQAQSGVALVFLPQQIVWYVLVALAFVGLVVGLRRDLLLTCLLAGLATAGAAAVALNSGNIGTMIRHRDTVVPFVVWLSALGGVATVSRLAYALSGRRPAEGEESAAAMPGGSGDTATGQPATL